MKVFRKPAKPTPKKRLRAAAQRAAKYSEEDYASDEPNVRLSRAFVVVLLLHVVAVGGIFAFSALKDRQAGRATVKPEKSASFNEHMKFEVDKTGLLLLWENLKVPVSVK